MENLVTIGQFSELTRVSPKALRLYAANGLLMPTRVDADSGYRYYRAEQIPIARLIGLLRAAGMSQREIRRFLVEPSTEKLDRYELRLEAELADRRDVLRYVRRMLEEEPMFEVKVKHVPARRYVSKTTRVRVPDLEPFIVQTIDELAADGMDGPPFAIFHGLVNEEDDGPVEVGVPRAGGDKELPAGEVAYTVAADDDCESPRILGAYDAIARWLSESGRESQCPPREIYIEQKRWEIAWQLK
jgi:DNA-binding transcriptional MerR regulator